MKFRVQLKLHATERGGRKSPIYSGYRPDWKENLVSGYRCAQVLLEGELKPGDSTVAVLQPLTPDLWKDVRAGNVLAMHEGPHEVGVAVVTGVEST